MSKSFESWYQYFLTVLVGILIFCWIRQWIQETFYKLPPGPFRWPLLGNIPQLFLTGAKTPHEAINKLVKRHGNLLWLKIGSQSVASGFDNLKQLFKRDEWLGRTEFDWIMFRTYGKPYGLVFSNDLWQDTRRLVIHQLRDYGFGKSNSMEINTLEEIDEAKVAMWKDAVQNNGIVYPHKYFAIPGVNVTWSSVSGKRFDHQDPKMQEMIEGLANYTNRLQYVGGIGNSYPFLMKWFPKILGMEDLKASCDRIIKFFEDEVAAYKQPGRYKTDPQNFIESYLKLIEEKAVKENEVLSEEMLVSVLFDLLWAASHTTACIMEYALLWLALNPEAQTKLRQEVLQVIGTDRRPCLADKASMTYTKATIMEIHRRSAITPVDLREIRWTHEFNGFIIPGRTSASINLYGLNMDEDFWQDPENFRPERYLTPEGEINKIKAERVIPFTMGKRNCIGESIAECMIFLFVTSIIQEFRLSKSQTFYDLAPVTGLVSSPKTFSIKLEKYSN